MHCKGGGTSHNSPSRWTAPTVQRPLPLPTPTRRLWPTAACRHGCWRGRRRARGPAAGCCQCLGDDRGTGAVQGADQKEARRGAWVCGQWAARWPLAILLAMPAVQASAAAATPLKLQQQASTACQALLALAGSRCVNCCPASFPSLPRCVAPHCTPRSVRRSCGERRSCGPSSLQAASWLTSGGSTPSLPACWRRHWRRRGAPASWEGRFSSGWRWPTRWAVGWLGWAGLRWSAARRRQFG